MGEKSEPAKAEFFILALWIYWKKYTRGILCWLGLILHQRTCHYHPSSQEVFWLLQQLKHNQVKSKEKLIYNFDFSWSKIVCFFPDFLDYSAMRASKLGTSMMTTYKKIWWCLLPAYLLKLNCIKIKIPKFLQSPSHLKASLFLQT